MTDDQRREHRKALRDIDGLTKQQHDILGRMYGIFIEMEWTKYPVNQERIRNYKIAQSHHRRMAK